MVYSDTYGNHVEIDVFFPNFLYVKSNGAVNKTQFSRMGFFSKMLGLSHNDRPVWRHSNELNFLFYNGKRNNIFVY